MNRNIKLLYSSEPFQRYVNIGGRENVLGAGKCAIFRNRSPTGTRAGN